jgi:flagellar hook-associated protein FlgK
MLQDYNVGRNTNDSIVREAAEELAIQFNDYAKQLETLMNNETAAFKDKVSEVNTTLTKIRDLNESIRRAQVFGGGSTTQKDERNLLIDDLSKQIGINVIYEMENLGDGVEVEKLRITTSGDPERTLVDGIYATQLSIVQKGKDVPRTDSEGNPVLDGSGKQIYDKQNVDGDNFDLAISELTDARGITDPSRPNTLARTIERFKVLGEGGTPTGKNGTVGFETYAEAKAAADLLNSDPAYYTDPNDPTKAFYYHVGDASDQEGSDSGAVPPFYIHQHDTKMVGGVPTTDPNEGYLENSYRYTDVSAPQVTVLGDTELRGGLQAMRELLTEEGEYATDETISNVDPEAGSKRGIPYYRKALDTLARTFAEAMNEANRLPDNALYQTNNDGQIIGRSGALYTKQDDGTFKKNDGTVVDRNTAKQDFIVADGFEKYFNRNAEGKYLDADGNVLSDADQNDPTKYVVLDNYKEYFGGNLFSVSGVSNQDGTTGDDPGAEKITAANISISYDWSHGKLHVLRSIDPNASTTSRASDNLAHFVTMLKEKHDFTTGTNNQGTSYFKGTFQEMLTDTISGTLAKDQNITGTMLNNYNATADSLYVDRDAVMGVDLNDEAMNMMQFQKAYSAACRLMTTYDEMLEKLINGTGI